MRKSERNALASVIRLRRISVQASANFVARACIIRYEKSRKLIIMELRSGLVRLSRGIKTYRGQCNYRQVDARGLKKKNCEKIEKKQRERERKIKGLKNVSLMAESSTRVSKKLVGARVLLESFRSSNEIVRTLNDRSENVLRFNYHIIARITLRFSLPVTS